MASDCLRPKAEGAARFAAAARIEGDVRVLEVAAEIVLDDKVAFVHWGYEWKCVHVLEDRAIGIVDNDAILIAIREADDFAEVPSIRHLLDRVIEFVAGYELDGA